jgi:hypothetical protein
VRVRGGGSSLPLIGRAFDPAVDYMEMNGIATWKQAITHLPARDPQAALREERRGARRRWISSLFHQANLRMIEYIVRKMGFGPGAARLPTWREIGNTGSASLAIAISEAVQKNLLIGWRYRGAGRRGRRFQLRRQRLALEDAVGAGGGNSGRVPRPCLKILTRSRSAICIRWSSVIGEADVRKLRRDDGRRQSAARRPRVCGDHRRSRISSSTACWARPSFRR